MIFLIINSSMAIKELTEIPYYWIHYLLPSLQRLKYLIPLPNQSLEWAKEQTRQDKAVCLLSWIFVSDSLNIVCVLWWTMVGVQISQFSQCNEIQHIMEITHWCKITADLVISLALGHWIPQLKTFPPFQTQDTMTVTVTTSLQVIRIRVNRVTRDTCVTISPQDAGVMLNLELHVGLLLVLLRRSADLILRCVK